MWRDAECTQEPAEDVARSGRAIGRVAVKVFVKCTIEEVVADSVAPVHRQRRLADPWWAGNHDHAGYTCGIHGRQGYCPPRQPDRRRKLAGWREPG
jgi:ribosome modulation factor